MINLIVFVIALFVNLIVMGGASFVYSGLETYQDGMIFGIHIPKEEMENEQVRTVCRQFEKKRKRFIRTGFLSGSLVCFFCFLSMGLFLILYVLWMIWFLVNVWLSTGITIRRMYKIKERMDGVWSRTVAGSEERKGNQSPAMTDDDIYWKNGWYANPHDKKLWIQNRICSTNYSMNMARPAAKVIMVITGTFLAAAIIALVGLGVVLIELQITGVEMTVSAESVKVTGGWYSYEFEKSKIESIKIYEEIPDDRYVRTNGGDMEQYLLGYFQGKKAGKVLMFYHKKTDRVIEIKVNDITIFVNASDKEKTEEWYEKLRADVKAEGSDMYPLYWTNQ